MNSAVLLSRGGTWKPSPWDPPYLMPDPGSTWPEKAWAAITFTDTAGVELLTLDGDVTPEGIHFTGDPEEMDPIPAGAGFTITLETGDGIFPIRYGTVIRKEVFYTQPTNRPVSTPRRFSDTFQRKTLGNKWIPIVGRTIIRNNSLLSLPNGVSPEVAFFQKSAIRWWEEFSSDTVDIGITVLNTDPILTGRTTLVLCADALFTTGIGVRFETAALSNKLHLGTITGPNTLVDETPAVTNTVANLDHYRIRYTDSTKTVAVYKNSSLDPALQWTDDAAAIAHGRGYRHFGMAFESALLGRGIQVTSITAMDAA
mgnify:CR=1 FL=1